jgi:HJR/Mrr/RecB family endonuclease
MLDTSEMIIASLSKVWHLVPIVIAIVLFKKFLDYKEKKRRIKINEENEKNGLTLELRTVKNYEDLGYKIEEGKKDQGIDLLCYKGDKTLLFQYTNSSKSKSIIDEDIETFCSNAIKYVETNDIKGKDIEFRYVIPYSDLLHKSAIKIFTDDSYNCKYVVL